MALHSIASRCGARRNGFTLVELLVVLALLVVLLAFLMPLARRAKEMADRVACASQLRQLGLAAYAYMTDYNGFGPPNVEPDVANFQSPKWMWAQYPQTLEKYFGSSSPKLPNGTIDMKGGHPMLKHVYGAACPARTASTPSSSIISGMEWTHKAGWAYAGNNRILDPGYYYQQGQQVDGHWYRLSELRGADSRTILFMDSPKRTMETGTAVRDVWNSDRRHRTGMNFCLVDGHVEFATPLAYSEGGPLLQSPKYARPYQRAR